MGSGRQSILQSISSWHGNQLNCWFSGRNNKSTSRSGTTLRGETESTNAAKLTVEEAARGDRLVCVFESFWGISFLRIAKAIAALRRVNVDRSETQTCSEIQSNHCSETRTCSERQNDLPLSLYWPLSERPIDGGTRLDTSRGRSWSAVVFFSNANICSLNINCSLNIMFLLL